MTARFSANALRSYALAVMRANGVDEDQAALINALKKPMPGPVTNIRAVADLQPFFESMGVDKGAPPRMPPGPQRETPKKDEPEKKPESK